MEKAFLLQSFKWWDPTFESGPRSTLPSLLFISNIPPNLRFFFLSFIAFIPVERLCPCCHRRPADIYYWIQFVLDIRFVLLHVILQLMKIWHIICILIIKSFGIECTVSFPWLFDNIHNYSLDSWGQVGHFTIHVVFGKLYK